MTTFKVREESSWAKCSMLKKRINGFVSYLVAAMFSLIGPVAVDMEMLDILREQFEDES